MSVRICGHKVRCNKLIKIYTLTKHICVLLMLVMICGPAMAADVSDAERCASVVPSSGIDPVQKPKPRSQVGEEITPAVALAIAFGMRNISGVNDKSAYHYSPRDPSKVASKNPSASSRHAASRTTDGSSSPGECQAPLDVPQQRLPRLAMQR